MYKGTFGNWDSDPEVAKAINDSSIPYVSPLTGENLRLMEGERIIPKQFATYPDDQEPEFLTDIMTAFRNSDIDKIRIFGITYDVDEMINTFVPTLDPTYYPLYLEAFPNKWPYFLKFTFNNNKISPQLSEMFKSCVSNDSVGTKIAITDAILSKNKSLVGYLNQLGAFNLPDTKSTLHEVAITLLSNPITSPEDTFEWLKWLIVSGA